MDMPMTNRVPDWLTPVAWTYIALSLLAAASIAYDIYARRHRHSSMASEVVWVTCALYLGPFAVPLYQRYGRQLATGDQAERSIVAGPPSVVAGLPGGSASTIAHLIGVPLVIASGLTIAGINLWVMIIVIGILAMVLLFTFDRAARGDATTRTVGTAVAAAILTVLAFDIGMGGWMLLLHFNEFMPPATEGSFWFLMQLGIILGLLTGYPVVKRLHRSQESFVSP